MPTITGSLSKEWSLFPHANHLYFECIKENYVLSLVTVTARYCAWGYTENESWILGFKIGILNWEFIWKGYHILDQDIFFENGN